MAGKIIRWERGKILEGEDILGWQGFLGSELWCEFIEPYEGEETKEGGYVFGVAIDGWMCDVPTIEEAKEQAEEFTVKWLAHANLTSITVGELQELYTKIALLEDDKEQLMTAICVANGELWRYDLNPSGAEGVRSIMKKLEKACE